MNEADLAALVLVAALSYRGYRRGLIMVVVGLSGGLVAFALAAVLTPILAPRLAPLATDHFDPSNVVARGVLLAALTLALRLLLGRALRELAAALRSLIGQLPPLAALDRLLGAVVMAALGAALALALLIAALALPNGTRLRTIAAASWLARAPVAHPVATYARVRSAVDRFFSRTLEGDGPDGHG